MPTVGNPRKTIRIADADLRTWLEEKAKTNGVSETGIILQALYTLRALDGKGEGNEYTPCAPWTETRSAIQIQNRQP